MLMGARGMKGPNAPHPGEGIQTHSKATEHSRSGFAAFDTLHLRAGAMKGSVPRATPHKLTPGSLQDHTWNKSHIWYLPCGWWQQRGAGRSCQSSQGH